MSNRVEKHIFSVWGAPGGGKTTLAVNMATVLADSGYMTCLVSASDHGEIQSFFGTAIPKNKGLYAAITSGKNVRESLIEVRPHLCLLELDTGGDAYDIYSITPEQVSRMLADLRDQFTYVIIDCTSYKEAVFTGTGLAESDKVVVCIPHRGSAAMWHNANAQMLEAVASKTIYVDVNTRAGGCNMEQLLAAIDLPECEIKIGCVDSAYSCENTSKPIVLHGGRREQAYKKAVLKLIRCLIDLEAEDRAIRAGTAKRKPEKKTLRKAEGLTAKKKMSSRAERREEDRLMRQARNDDSDYY